MLRIALAMGTIPAELPVEKTPILDAAVIEAPAVDEADRRWIESLRGPEVESTLVIAESLIDGNVPTNEPLRSDSSVRIFVSFAMTSSDLKAAFDAAVATPSSIVVFRGLPEGESLPGFQRRLSALLGPLPDLVRLPHIEIDPPAFVAADVTDVPTVVVYENNRVTASVTGQLDPAWLIKQVTTGRRGRLPARGPVVTPIEADLMLVLQERFRSIDWSAWRASQVQALTRSIKAHVLPEVNRTRTRFHDPTFLVERDVIAGEVILARAGARVNPLDRMPFFQKLVVFDATVPWQRERIDHWLREHAAGEAMRVTLLTTRVDESDPFGFLERTSRHMGHPIQMLSPAVAGSFAIERVPSVVAADGNRFRINELAPIDGTGGSSAPKP